MIQNAVERSKNIYFSVVSFVNILQWSITKYKYFQLEMKQYPDNV